MTTTRRLAAILAADVAGYSQLIGADEEGTLNRLKAIRAEIIDPKINEHRGRIVKTTGDGLLVEFASVVDALRCATAWQAGMAERNTDTPDDRIEFRIGINVGDIVVENEDIFGDGVNVAGRLEALAEPGGICVSARVQEDAAGRLDLTFEDMGEQALKNIARSVRVYKVRLAGMERKPTAAPIVPLPDKPSIAVLPFQNISGDPEQEYFADGMVEEVITALSRIRWLFVIACNSSFSYKSQSPDVKQVGRELGVRYILEGSVRKGGNRVRITAQLIEAATGTHLWADRFDGSLEDVFDLQDKVAISIAGVIEPALQVAETHRSAERPTNDLTAYDLYLRARPIFLSSGKQGIIAALELLEQAVARDPNYGPALGLAAVCHTHLVGTFPEDPEANRRKGIDRAQHALRVAGDDPGVLADAALTLGVFGEEIGAMTALVDRALGLNPSYARGWYVKGLLNLWAGRLDDTIGNIETSLRLSPRAHLGNPFGFQGAAYFLDRRFEEAVATLSLAIQQKPHFPLPYRYLSACYAHMGRLDDARATVERLRGITKDVVPSATGLRNPAHHEFFLSGLRLAMSETT